MSDPKRKPGTERDDERLRAMNDVTDRKRAEEALRRNAETFARLVEQSPLGIYTVDADFRIANVSAGSEPAFRNVQPVIGRDFGEVMHALWPEPFASEAIAIFRHTLETGEPYVSPGLTEQRKDIGQIESYEWQVNRVMLADGRPGVVCYYFDATRIQQVNRALRESEEKYRSLFDSIDEGFSLCQMITDGNGKALDYRFLELNPAFETMAGITVADAEGKTVREVVPGIEERWIETYARAASAGETIRFENYVAVMDRWFDVFASPVNRDAPDGKFIAVFRDVTERKTRERYQEYLLKLSEALRPLADLEEIQFVAARMLGQAMNVHRVAYFEIEGDEYVVYRDYHEEDAASLVGRYPVDIYGPWQRAEYEAGRTVVVTDSGNEPNFSDAERAQFVAMDVIGYVAAPLVKGGQYVACLAIYSPVPRTWTSYEIDVVEETAERTWAALERARAETALRESEEQRELALEATQLGTFVWDVKDDRTEADAGMMVLLDQQNDGLSLRDAIATMIHPEDAQRYAAAAAAAVQPEGSRNFHEDVRMRRADGSWRWLSIAGRTYFDETGQPLRMIGTALDISERKRAEIALRESDKRQAFLLKLSDALRPLSDPVAVQGETARLLRDHFNVGWCFYAEFDDDDKTAVIVRDAVREGLPSLAGRHDMSDILEYVEFIRTGRMLNVPDFARCELLTPRVVARYTPIGVRTMLGVALVKDGRLVSQLVMHDTAPRDWPREAEDILREVAERTWAAVERARAEAALRESEEKYAALFSASPAPFLVLKPDAPRFTIAVVNDAYLAATMRTREDLVGRGVFEAFPDNPDDATIAGVSTLRASLERVLASQQPDTLPSLKYDIARPDGTFEERWWTPVNSAVLDRKGEVVAIIHNANDVTEQYRAEAALRESEERYKQVVNQVKDYAIFSTDTRGRATTWNEGVERVLGFDAAEFVGQDVTQAIFTPEDVASGVPQNELETAAREGIADNTRWMQRKAPGTSGGATRFFAQGGTTAVRNDAGDVVAFTKVLRDITEQKETQDQIKGARDYAEATLRTSPVPLLVLDNDLRIHTANEAFYEAFQVNEAETKGRFVYDLGNKQWDIPKLRERLENILPQHTILRGFEVTHEFETIGTRTMLLNARQMQKEPDAPVRIILVIEDISERKQAEDTLRRSEAALQEADRRKDEFLAMLAHELRNPLAPIRTGLELIRLAGDTPGSVERVRVMMERQIAHMVRLIDDLLDVSRITSGKIQLQREPTPLDTLVNSAIETNRAAMTAKQIELRVDLPETLCVLDVDPTRFIQVLSNLLHNATKFTDAGGSIGVSAHLIDGAQSEAQELTLSVTDSGIGIPPELLPRVFDLFTQGERGSSQPGLGLGLALARRLVEMHGGHIDVRSEGLGRGSEFVIRMPLSTQIPQSRVAESSGSPGVDCRVMVIDDNRDAATVLTMLVEELGGECRTAYDGESGLREVLNYRPHVVLLDIGMPGVDGYETCRRIRLELGEDVVVVAVTGFGQNQDKEHAARAGFDAHLTKPTEPAALQKLLLQCGRA